MTDPVISDQGQTLEPVHAGEDESVAVRWSTRLALFLRIMAVLSLGKGLYHWSVICGIGEGPDGSFENGPMSWQSATAFFAVIDLVAAIGLWLAAAWGAVVWLTASISMVAVVVLFPQVFSAGMYLAPAELVLLGIYLWLALQAAREQAL
ncbi:MAG TPA: DUF6163 family protein [Xanthobacteraceae bacterium]|nr:DUF6163 family protein [Xanthobacteraceae bacterium]